MYIHNVDSITHVYEGHPVLAGDYYQIQDYELVHFSNNSTLLRDLAYGLVRMASDTTGSNDYYDLNESINFLKEKETPILADYSESFYKKVESVSEELSTGVVIPAGQVVAVKSIEGTGVGDSWTAVAFGWGTPSEKILGVLRESELIEFDVALNYSRVVGDGVSKLQIVLVNNRNVSSAIGGKFEAVVI